MQHSPLQEQWLGTTYQPTLVNCPPVLSLSANCAYPPLRRVPCCTRSRPPPPGSLTCLLAWCCWIALLSKFLSCFTSPAPRATGLQHLLEISPSSPSDPTLDLPPHFIRVEVEVTVSWVHSPLRRPRLQSPESAAAKKQNSH